MAAQMNHVTPPWGYGAGGAVAIIIILFGAIIFGGGNIFGKVFHGSRETVSKSMVGAIFVPKCAVRCFPFHFQVELAELVGGETLFRRPKSRGGGFLGGVSAFADRLVLFATPFSASPNLRTVWADAPPQRFSGKVGGRRAGRPLPQMGTWRRRWPPYSRRTLSPCWAAPTAPAPPPSTTWRVCPQPGRPSQTSRVVGASSISPYCEVV